MDYTHVKLVSTNSVFFYMSRIHINIPFRTLIKFMRIFITLTLLSIIV